eukprot:TRINITY_DN1021_c1_g1_i1.p1 TRINITY_DN1021_c1_g1~~TRINITY_DN1021_c1_g1_i1.p1  ORF type:complete len:135 (-),score=41.00 TRINITY_DN1021_c1_g1_i1:317-721(-)
MKIKEQMDSVIDFLSTNESSNLVVETIEKNHAFVCTHGNRDKRCGTKGVEVADQLCQAVEVGDIEDLVVCRTSHIGGHAYAGNCIVTGSGNWYGNLDQENCVESVKLDLDGGIAKENFRGRIGVAKEDSKALIE